MSKRLEGKVAIVTGASRGRGAATAALFVAEGANVVLTDLNEPSPSLLLSMGNRALFLRHDVSSPSDWREVVTRTREQFGKLDILINNAGVYRPGGLVDTDDALWDFHYRVNQLGVFLGMRAVVESMQEAAGGSIVNVSSNAGIGHVPGIFSYATTKWRCVA
jgi:3alpha(or 20beta)-hydroxysteroid dehydrogenase